MLSEPSGDVRQTRLPEFREYTNSMFNLTTPRSQSSTMSFRATPIALAREKLVLQTSRPGQKLPKYLKSRVVLAEATEREYQAKVDTARAAGQPVPKFKQPLKLAPDQLKWYSVSRSEKGNLPVYTDFRGDGGVLTMIRRIKVSFFLDYSFGQAETK